MQKLAFLGGVAGLGAAAMLAVQISPSQAADHVDAMGLGANPMADINDVYTWMDGSKLNLALTVSPVDVPARAFGPSVQYVFHVHSKTGLGAGVQGTGTETRVICTFRSNTDGSCWVVDPSNNAVKDYVTGDPSNTTTGVTSASGKVRLFAGRRSDPFYFNLQGFRESVKVVKAAAPTITFNAAGCPNNLMDAAVGVVRGHLAATEPVGEPPCPNNVKDCFAQLNVRVVLVQVDKTLVNAGANFSVGVWASTHQGTP